MASSCGTDTTQDPGFHGSDTPVEPPGQVERDLESTEGVGRTPQKEGSAVLPAGQFQTDFLQTTLTVVRGDYC